MGFIEKSNKVLLFIAAILMIFAIGKEIISDFFRNVYTQPTVHVVKKDLTDNKTEKITLIKRYVGSINDVHIIELTSDTVMKLQGFTANSALINSPSTSFYGLSLNAVNLMFTKAGSKNRVLFKHNSLIVDFSPAQLGEEKYHYKLTRNIYLVAKADTNQDGVLNSDDTKDLYVSAYNGEALSSVISNIQNFSVIDDDLLLIEQNSDEGSSFYIYNVLSSDIIKLDTKL